MFAHKLVLLGTTLLLLSSAVQSQSSISLKDANFQEAQKAPETTSEVPLTSSSSTSTSTTTTTTTAAPTTSTTTVKTSTSSSSTSTTTTTSTSTSTSTEPPKTTTTPAPVPTTTHAPQPYPAPSVGTWNATCILLTMAAQLNFTYETKDGKMAHGLFNIPPNATIGDSVCDSQSIQSIQLSWGPVTSVQSMVMQFDNKNATTVLSSIQIHFSVITEDYPDAKENQTLQLIHRGSEEFKTPEKMSYHCTRPQKLNLTETVDLKPEIGWLSVSNVQAEAFRGANASGFSTVHDCDSSETSDVVPIAVGIALAALILVVLISYLCVRRRSISRGYMSF
ncbi:lysosome-associated membrane glycoprotein 1 [Drosophila pseudoobscura]|uniref:Lysosome-associated membrane glycoprotein 5 n=1 Tax=Drosophila pseudoobscura pseudoobscura TaxID=46245 RepID=A0A6I8W0T2_DROPS|nr:lysosome-associated membrane glycoprotein 1 [Drosophila pseudoobscura]